MKFTSDMHSACGCASSTSNSISHVELAPGWELIRVNFDPIQEIGPKVEVSALS